MKLERMTKKNHPLYEQAMALYRSSFPPHEQRETPSQERILQQEDYHFSLIYDGEIFVGLVLYWEREGDIYIEHFCILPEARNRRYGERTLALLGEKGKTLILEIDPPVDEISRRRKGFYERCGFAANPYAHVHPPYHRGNQGHPLILMTFPEGITAAQYASFADYLRGRVMEDVFV